MIQSGELSVKSGVLNWLTGPCGQCSPRQREPRRSNPGLSAREEGIRLRAKLELAEQSRLAGEKAFSIEESRARLNAIYDARRV